MPGEEKPKINVRYENLGKREAPQVIDLEKAREAILNDQDLLSLVKGKKESPTHGGAEVYFLPLQLPGETTPSLGLRINQGRDAHAERPPLKISSIETRMDFYHALGRHISHALMYLDPNFDHSLYPFKGVIGIGVVDNERQLQNIVFLDLEKIIKETSSLPSDAQPIEQAKRVAQWIEEASQLVKGKDICNFEIVENISKSRGYQHLPEITSKMTFTDKNIEKYIGGLVAILQNYQIWTQTDKSLGTVYYRTTLSPDGSNIINLETVEMDYGMTRPKEGFKETALYKSFSDAFVKIGVIQPGEEIGTFHKAGGIHNQEKTDNIVGELSALVSGLNEVSTSTRFKSISIRQEGSNLVFKGLLKKNVYGLNTEIKIKLDGEDFLLAFEKIIDGHYSGNIQTLLKTIFSQVVDFMSVEKNEKVIRAELLWFEAELKLLQEELRQKETELKTLTSGSLDKNSWQRGSDLGREISSLKSQIKELTDHSTTLKAEFLEKTGSEYAIELNNTNQKDVSADQKRLLRSMDLEMTTEQINLLDSQKDRMEIRRIRGKLQEWLVVQDMYINASKENLVELERFKYERGIIQSLYDQVDAKMKDVSTTTSPSQIQETVSPQNTEHVVETPSSLPEVLKKNNRQVRFENVRYVLTGMTPERRRTFLEAERIARQEETRNRIASAIKRLEPAKELATESTELQTKASEVENETIVPEANIPEIAPPPESQFTKPITKIPEASVPEWKKGMIERAERREKFLSSIREKLEKFSSCIGKNRLDRILTPHVLSEINEFGNLTELKTERYENVYTKKKWDPVKKEFIPDLASKTEKVPTLEQSIRFIPSTSEIKVYWKDYQTGEEVDLTLKQRDENGNPNLEITSRYRKIKTPEERQTVQSLIDLNIFGSTEKFFGAIQNSENASWILESTPKAFIKETVEARLTDRGTEVQRDLSLKDAVAKPEGSPMDVELIVEARNAKVAIHDGFAAASSDEERMQKELGERVFESI